jgi:hypothetical protein
LSFELDVGFPRLSAGRFLSSGSGGVFAEASEVGAEVVAGAEADGAGDEPGLVGAGEEEDGAPPDGAFSDGGAPAELGGFDLESCVLESFGFESGAFESEDFGSPAFESSDLESDSPAFAAPPLRNTGRASASSAGAFVAAGAFFFAVAA